MSLFETVDENNILNKFVTEFEREHISFYYRSQAVKITTEKKKSDGD